VPVQLGVVGWAQAVLITQCVLGIVMMHGCEDSSPGGSWSTRRRAMLRSKARLARRGSTFWSQFLSAAISCRHLSPLSLDSSTSSCGSLDSGRMLSVEALDDFDRTASSPSHAPPSLWEVTSPWLDATLHCPAMCQLLECWSVTTLRSCSAFGVFASDFLGGRIKFMPGHCKDLLPLPLATQCMFDDWTSPLGTDLSLRLLNLSIAGLNFLFRGGRTGDVPRLATGLHKRAINRLKLKFDNAIAELLVLERPLGISGSLERLAGSVSSHRYPDLRAADVDYLPGAAKIDPMPFLPSEVQTLLSSPGLLFPGGVSHIPARRQDNEKHHGDRVTLTIRLLRAGKLSLAQDAMASADTFTVGKPGGDRLREIWNGGLLTSASVDSWKPPHQACPASLATLEASDDRPLWMSTRDGRVFFDQLALPPSLRSYLGRPLVAITDLKSPPPCESGAQPAEGLSDTELLELLVDGPLSSATSSLVPLNNAFPMGFGWSSYVAQSTMVHACTLAGFKREQLLSSERALTHEAAPAIAIATDDVNMFQRLSFDERSQFHGSPLDALDETWRTLGIQGHPGKASDLVGSGKVLGVQFRDGIRLQAKGDRMWSLFEASIDLEHMGMASPGHIAGLNGHLHWQNLLNRPLYSCLHGIYRFVHMQPEHIVRRVPAQVTSDIFLNVALFPFWSADLRRPWWSFLPATDASPAFGYGLSIARCEPGLSRSIGAVAADPSAVIRLAPCADEPAEVPRVGFEYRLPLTMDDFRTTFSIPAHRIAHSGEMEMAAVKLAILRITRNARTHGHRGVVLVDAQAVGYALRKGRSSAGTFRFGVAAIAALSLAADLKLSYPYLPSESNPADYPSRGKTRARTARRTIRKPHRPGLEKLTRSCRRAVRNLRSRGEQVF
jgi:hypothetical protein